MGNSDFAVEASKRKSEFRRLAPRDNKKEIP